MPSTFAIIPAAGNSERMGQAKLAMQLAGRPVIEHTLRAWQLSQVDRIIVVVQSRASPLSEIISRFADPQSRIEQVFPESPPPDMKASIQFGLRHIEGRYSPPSSVAVLVAPADMPRLSAGIIDLLLQRRREHPEQILVPTLGNRRGHPILIPWPLASGIHSLAADEGLNSLVERESVVTLPAEHVAQVDDEAFIDLDTPAQFAEFARQLANARRRDEKA